MARRKGVEGPFANGAAVDEHGAFGSFPEASDESGESGFAAAGGADDGERRTGGNTQIDIVQNAVGGGAIAVWPELAFPWHWLRPWWSDRRNVRL